MTTAVPSIDEAVGDPAPALPSAIILKGRTFRRATSTSVDQDAYVTKRLRDSGLSTILQSFDPAVDDIVSLNERIIWEAFERGVMYEVLAGVLVEDGVPWSRATAAKNAMLMAQITDPSEKAPILSSVADFLFDFFAVAAAWSSASMKSIGKARATASGRPTGGEADDGSAAAESNRPDETTRDSVVIPSTTTANGTR